ncbi:sulfotransferase family protein [Microbulbifer magnicolonia]|uniref:sulfotransferase family protein n=1 Tax=Microbulbifer magnicolonia TaxID=3109744 RepID=UPI002B40F4AC|nr:sulfotransferase family protein [Microbulbifer sp. GG15]
MSFINKSFIESIKKTKPISDFNNHTYISLKNKYVYLAVGKAANSTIKHHLYELEYHNTKFKTLSLHDRRCSPLLSPFQLDADFLAEFIKSDDVFKFTFVRNPFSRLLSCYLDRIVPKKSAPYRQLIKLLGKEVGDDISFESFVLGICDQSPYEMNNHWRLQVDEVCYSHINFDYIGRVESFAQDMANVWPKIAGNFESESLGEENKAPSITKSNSRLVDYYSERLVSSVVDKFSRDFEVFGYSMDLNSAY